MGFFDFLGMLVKKAGFFVGGFFVLFIGVGIMSGIPLIGLIVCLFGIAMILYSFASN
jgi:hypothetical protein